MLSDAALQRAEKLATAGRLSATLAHEINNPLEAITNLIYIVRNNAHWTRSQDDASNSRIKSWLESPT